jgi:hypothetical protein
MEHLISTVGPGYAGMETTRSYAVHVLAGCGSVGQPPVSVTVNEAPLPQGTVDNEPGTWFMGSTSGGPGPDTHITLRPGSSEQQQVVTVCCAV